MFTFHRKNQFNHRQLGLKPTSHIYFLLVYYFFVLVTIGIATHLCLNFSNPVIKLVFVHYYSDTLLWLYMRLWAIKSLHIYLLLIVLVIRLCIYWTNLFGYLFYLCVRHWCLSGTPYLKKTVIEPWFEPMTYTTFFIHLILIFVRILALACGGGNLLRIPVRWGYNFCNTYEVPKLHRVSIV